MLSYMWSTFWWLLGYPEEEDIFDTENKMKEEEEIKECPNCNKRNSYPPYFCGVKQPCEGPTGPPTFNPDGGRNDFYSFGKHYLKQVKKETYINNEDL